MSQILESADPTILLDPKQVSNIVNGAKRKRREAIQEAGGEVNMIANKIQAVNAKEPGWIAIMWHDQDNVLKRFFWMSPLQVTLLRLYGEVLVVDTSENRNNMKYSVATIMVVDSENKSRNVAYCLSHRQDQETFIWLFQQLKQVMESKTPILSLNAVFSDRALAIAIEIREVWPAVFHGICLWHLLENIKQNLLGTLGGSYNVFLSQFMELYSCGSVHHFEEAADKLL